MKIAFPTPAHHCVARCTECDWSCDWYIDAARKAEAHVVDTGHKVEIEEARTLFRTTEEESGKAFIEGRQPRVI